MSAGSDGLCDAGSAIDDMARLTSALFVSALLRRASVEGAFAVIARKGAAEAGAIFVRVDGLDGRQWLYAPAPQSFFDEDESGERRFVAAHRGSGEDAPAINARLEKEMRFDSDLWIVDIEDRLGRPFIEVIEDEG